MDQNMNTSGMPGAGSSNMMPTEKKTVGPVIGLIIILIIILLGGIYFWMSRDKAVPMNNLNSTNQEEQVSASNEITTQGSSDDTSSIQADLEAFGESDIDSVDAI